MAMTTEEFNSMWAAHNAGQTTTRHGDPEHRLQCKMIRWFRLQHTNHLCVAIPNGGQRNKIVAAKMKQEGVTAGMPDLLIPEPRHGYNNLWIEVKNGKAGRLSEVQKEMHERLTDHGNKVVVVRSFEEFVEVVNEYFT